MTTTKKPREFWVICSPQLGELCFESDEKAANETYEFEKECYPDTTTKVHVIEYSAYVQLQAENENHKELNRKLANHNADYAEEIATLKRKLEKAVSWIKEVEAGPAKTMAEPKSVWYSTHSARVLKELDSIKE